MKLTDIRSVHWRRLMYRIRHEYMTPNNTVLALAVVIAIAWAWGSINVMQRNYELQRKVDTKQRELTLAELEVQTLEFQQRYYQSSEFLELEARRSLGLANPGEKVLILPENSKAAKQVGAQEQNARTAQLPEPSNMQQWLDFFSGRSVQRSEDS